MAAAVAGYQLPATAAGRKTADITASRGLVREAERKAHPELYTPHARATRLFPRRDDRPRRQR